VAIVPARGPLHAVHGADSQKFYALANHAGREIDEYEPALPQFRRLGLQYWAVFEKAAEMPRQLPQVAREVMRLIGLTGDLQRFLEARELQGQRFFLRSGKRRHWRRATKFGYVDCTFAHDPLAAREGVLHVRRGVALGREHLVEEE